MTVRETDCSVFVPLSEMARWLRYNDLEQAWLDGFEEGVAIPEYCVDDDCETDQPWCCPWLWESEDCEVEIVKDWIDEDGLEGCVYRAAKGWGDFYSGDIAAALEAEEEEEA